MRIKSVVALMCIGLILIMCGCRETREKLSGEEYFYKDEVGGDREPEMEAEEKIKQEYVREEKEISENKTVFYIGTGVYEQDGYLMLSGDPGISKGFDIQEDAHEYLLDVVDGLLKENR